LSHCGRRESQKCIEIIWPKADAKTGMILALHLLCCRAELERTKRTI
jgi:hypothetical protein